MTEYVFRVAVPMLHPLPARAGDCLVVCPGDEVAPLVVVRRRGSNWEPVRVGPPNYGALAGLIAEGVLTPHSPQDAAFLGAVA